MRRALTILAGWGLLFAASPGVLWPDGSLLLAILGVGVVGSALGRSQGQTRRALLFGDWIAGGIGATLALWWVYFVAPPALLYVAAVLGIYQLIAGLLIRQLARKYSLGVAVAMGWLGAELLRTLLIPPLGLGWMQLGHHSSHHLWLAGSARVWGVEGLSLVVAALGGALAQLIAERKLSKGSLGLAAGSLSLGIGFSYFTQPVPMLPGPTAMVVQPGLTQDEKFERGFLPAMRELTLAALARHAESGAAPVDFVAWGESMLPITQVEPAVHGALLRGGNLPAWRPKLSTQTIEGLGRWEQAELTLPLLSKLPEGCHLLTGVEVIDAEGQDLQRYVGTALFGPHGRLGPVAKKRFLVPGGETMLGLERFEFVRKAALQSIGYLPDFRPGTETGILELPARDGRIYRIAAMACFDNAFVTPALEALAAGPVDFHVVTSNEAWYQDACEMDQMVTFSRLLAIATGRSLLRATNSGVSLLIGPDGAELGRLRVGDRDRSVRGELVVTIPVPADGGDEGPPYVRLRGFLRAAIALLLGAMLWKCRRGKTPNE